MIAHPIMMNPTLKALGIPIPVQKSRAKLYRAFRFAWIEMRDNLLMEL
jgi:hypothetical protein